MNKTLTRLVSLVLLLSMLAACGAASGGRGAPEPAVELATVQKEVRSAGDSYAGGVTSANADHDQTQIEQMIIWNATISLTVKDTQESMDATQAIARELGGYMIGSESWLSDEQLYVTLTIRVPANRFEEAMIQLRDLALKVNRESATSEDVTDQYVDLESRLRHLEAEEAQLLEFLKQAEDTEAVLAVYDHLSETQAEIEQVKGRMAYLEKLSAMATITVELYPEEAELPVVEEGWKPVRTLRSAARSLVSTLQGLGDAIIWFAIYLLPVLLIIALPIALLIWAVRRWRRGRHPTHKQSPQEE
jgi:hypothetical protein